MRNLASSIGAMLERLGPQLWRPRQYSPRPLKLPDSYRLETSPKDPFDIAVVTPSYNQGRYVSAAIESVLGQNYPRLHYRVEDGGSSDQTREILETFGGRLNWRSEPDAGQADAINRGFSEIRGEIMGYLNSDDMLLPGSLAYVARAFAENPDVDFVYGHRIFIDENGLETGRWITAPHDSGAGKWVNIIPQETMFWRRRVWDKIGPFDKQLDFALDWDFILRAQAAGFRFRRLPRFIGAFRVHDCQKTALMWDVNRREAARLKMKYLGFNPGDNRTTLALFRFYCRHMALQHLHNAGLGRY